MSIIRNFTNWKGGKLSSLTAGTGLIKIACSCEKEKPAGLVRHTRSMAWEKGPVTRVDRYHRLRVKRSYSIVDRFHPSVERRHRSIDENHQSAGRSQQLVHRRTDSLKSRKRWE